MVFKDGKTFSAYVRSKLHSGYITLGWVTVQDTVLVAKDVIVTCHVPLWLMSYEHTRGSQSAP